MLIGRRLDAEIPGRSGPAAAGDGEDPWPSPPCSHAWLVDPVHLIALTFLSLSAVFLAGQPFRLKLGYTFKHDPVGPVLQRLSDGGIGPSRRYTGTMRRRGPQASVDGGSILNT